MSRHADTFATLPLVQKWFKATPRLAGFFVPVYIDKLETTHQIFISPLETLQLLTEDPSLKILAVWKQEDCPTQECKDTGSERCYSYTRAIAKQNQITGSFSISLESGQEILRQGLFEDGDANIYRKYQDDPARNWDSERQCPVWIKPPQEDLPANLDENE
ncbi:MAG: hypothetical protein ACNI27_04695 [Desulfovibrio sp.]